MTLLADILAQVTLARVFVFSFLFLVISFIVDLACQPRYPDSIPVLGHDSQKWFSTIRNSFAYFTQHQAWTGEGYEKYGKNGLPFIAPAPLSRPPDVVMPRSQAAWMMNQPDHILSAAHAHDKIMHSEYNFLGKDLTEDDFGPRVVHKYLARNLPALVPAIADETNATVQDALETLIKAAAEKNPKNVDAEGFTKVNLWEMWLAIVPRITNRLLVGETICRDPSFIDSMVRFTDDVVRNSFLLHAFPQVLHPIIGRLITIPNYLHWRTAARRVVPIIEQRIKDIQRKEAGDPEMKNWSPPEDYFTWHIRLAMAEGNSFELDPIVVSKRLLPINFAAIHTTVLTGHSWMLDLWSLSPDGRALDTLRDELEAHQPTEGPWTKQSLASLVRLDSSFRESQRLSNFAANLVERQVIAPEGLHNPEYGWTLPQGAFVTLNLQGTHHDDEIFEGAMKYNPWRYSNSREQWERKTAEEKKENEKEGLRVKGLGMVTISDTHLAFGLGRHACPGRFFVAHELKLIAAKLLLDYDIKTIEERPKAQWLGATIIPPLDACIEIRPRASRR